MRQLSIQEVEVVSGATSTDTPIMDLTVSDVLTWGASYLSALQGYTVATGLGVVASHPLTIPGLGISATHLGLGAVGGVAGLVGGYIVSHYALQLFDSQVAARVG